jgi:hypothetical protein
MLLNNFGIFWHFLTVKDIEQSGVGLQESSDLTPSLSTEQCSSSGVQCFENKDFSKECIFPKLCISY